MILLSLKRKPSDGERIGRSPTRKRSFILRSRSSKISLRSTTRSRRSKAPSPPRSQIPESSPTRSQIQPSSQPRSNVQPSSPPKSQVQPSSPPRSSVQPSSRPKSRIQLSPLAKLRKKGSRLLAKLHLHKRKQLLYLLAHQD